MQFSHSRRVLACRSTVCVSVLPRSSYGLVSLRLSSAPPPLGEAGHASNHLKVVQTKRGEGCQIRPRDREAAGTERGYLYASSIPEMERYCSFKAHRLRTLDVVPLPPTVSDGALSLSAETVRYHSSGGFPRFTYTDELVSPATRHRSRATPLVSSCQHC